ncbi:IclR family transcriptional regulator [Cryptosporangium phraense]|uniref:IclR family transcriptional regulator n=1 Tax=Cryptosporangium phraense TaxID=2593070 RepID=A0A545AVA1_9ACTN|nr:IclR family transcriptional regulator [Cryptosporangium phraense]TQS45253.1 IclR family transcriptional regulator [Cryptosporangium phraense]
MIGALDRGLGILRLLAQHRRLSVPEIADALGLSRATAYRLVDRLRDEGWLISEGHGGPVRLGPTAAQLAAAAIESVNLRDVAIPVLRELVAETGETANLAVPNGTEMVFLAREQPLRTVSVAAHPGSTRPFHNTSVGRAYLAALPAARLDDLLAGLEAPGLREKLDVVRVRGWSDDRREYDPSSCCCGAAIRDHTGEPVGALSVAGVAERMDPVIDQIGPRVRDAAARISASLGFAGLGSIQASEIKSH